MTDYGLVETEYLLPVFDVKFKETQLIRDPTYHLAHSDYYLIVVVLEHQRLQEVWDELLLDLLGLNVVEDFEDCLDGLYPHVGFFVIE